MDEMLWQTVQKEGNSSIIQLSLLPFHVPSAPPLTSLILHVYSQYFQCFRSGTNAWLELSGLCWFGLQS